MRFFWLFFVLFFAVFDGYNQSDKENFKGCYARLEQGKLYIGNSQIERIFLWNNGNLITEKLLDKNSKLILEYNEPLPDLYLPGEKVIAQNADLSIETVKTSTKREEHLQVIVKYQLGNLLVKRLFRVYPNTSAIECVNFFKGAASSSWINEIAEPGNLSNIEVFNEDGHELPFAPVMDRIELPGRHWELRSVQFYDITDRYNNLCKESEDILYRNNIHKGNIAVLKDLTNNNQIFILKESPSYFSQIAYPGCDFLSVIGKVQVLGVGVDSADISNDHWVQGYASVIGFGGKSELETLIALRKYQKNIFPGYLKNEPVFITNTWGDRSKDTKITERFISDEIKATSRLGSNYLQIDDGWQNGRSQNSAFEGGSSENIWAKDGYWQLHPEKFPNGFEPIKSLADTYNVHLSLWYSPSIGDAYKDWKKDAETLVEIHEKYGIDKIKVDLLQLNDKLSEHRIRNMLDYAWSASDSVLSFDMDITANKRFGYHYFNEYGVYWVANRYTDWTNYYPYTTLRNLWMLSKYVPAEKLQMAFCNTWRNTENYQNDPFAPEKSGFDYAFATVMMAQPMGFFETSGLPDAGYAIKSTVDTYLEHQKNIHSGTILPIGSEPSGTSWTGFQSIIDEKNGYLLIYRELNDKQSSNIQTWLPANKSVKLIKILGYGVDKQATTLPESKILLTLNEPNSWVLYRYEILN